MKWGNEKNKAQTIFYYLGTVVLILVIFFMLVDYISWRDAIGMIKKNLPSDASVILQEGNSSVKWNPLRWRGPLRGRVYLFSNESLTTESRDVNWNGENLKDVAGFLDGSVRGISGVDIPLFQKSEIRYDGEKILQNASGSHSFHISVYLLDTGEKVYRDVFRGYEAVDYPITPSIITAYRESIDQERDMTEEDVKWLCTFTHDSLHDFVLSFFRKNEVPKLFQKPNIYAYRLDQKISSQVEWKKKYEKVWTGERKGACIGIIYRVDGKVYVRVVYDAWWLGCKGGGYIFNFWK